MAKKIFSWDAISNGLWGKTFAIGAVVYEDGQETQTFYARRPVREAVDPVVQQNVLPKMANMPTTHPSYLEMLSSFAKFYFANKDNADIIFHTIAPSKARIILDMYDFGFIDDEDYTSTSPWIDIAGCLKQAGFDSASVTAYNEKHGIIVPDNESGPLYNSRAAALCYMSLIP